MSQMLRPDSEMHVIERSGPAPVVDLRATVRNQVIPRLREALEGTLSRPLHPLVASRSRSFECEIPELADRLVCNDQPGGIDRIEALRSRGHDLCEIYLRLLAPTACYVRDLWHEDLCGLADATIALCHLQSILRHYASEFYGEAYRPDTGLRALLVSPTGKGSSVDPSVFSVMLLSEFFRRDGWDAWIERSFSSGRFRDTVLSGWFDLVEVLATSDKELDEIASGIRIIRRGSPNPQVAVIVCGEVFRDHPEFVRLVGADFAATDPQSSLSQARHFITRSTQRRRLS